MDTSLSIDFTDFTDYVAFNGMKWSRNDVDGPNTGRAMSGLMIRDRVATKIRLDITCRPLTTTELTKLQKALAPEFVNVNFYDPFSGGYRNAIMYSNSDVAQFLLNKNKSGYDLWNNITFPLVER